MSTIRRCVPLAAICVTIGVAAIASAAAPSLTIYSHDLALVRESRSLEVHGARDTVRITGLAAGLDFTSLRLTLSSGRVTRLAWRAGLSGGDELLGSYAIGRRVRVTTHADRTLDGVLLSADGSWLVIRGDDGALTTIARANAEEVRLADPPSSLLTRSGLEAVIEGAASRTSADLSYLTSGLSWSAEHVLVRKGESAGTWSAGVTVANNTGRDFVDADLALVAGDPHRESEMPQPRLMGAMAKSSMVAAEAAPDLSEQAFAEYHLYTLDRPTTLRAGEAQSLSMIAPREIKLTPRYLYRGGARGVTSQLEIVNDKASGLGVPLPAGRVRIYEAGSAGALRLIGESHVAHTPAGEKFTLDVGTAFDLAAERRQTADHRIADREREISVEILLRNRKDVGVTIVVEEPISGDVEVTAKTHEFVRKDANTLVFTIPVAAGKEEKLAYTARIRF